MNPAIALRHDQASLKPSAVASRGHLALTQENQGNSPWCGPAALALATGQSYAATCALLRAVLVILMAGATSPMPHGCSVARWQRHPR